MDPLPQLGLTVGISPVSSAATGSDMQNYAPVFERGAINFGSGASETPVSGIIRDGALVLILVFGAKWLWRKI